MPVASLPPELKTAKLNSLDSDLKGIAEQLIADKFGIKEEVVEQPTATFLKCSYCGRPNAEGVRCPCSQPNNGSGPGYNQGYPNEARYGFPGQMHQQITTNISWNGLLDSMHNMDRMNARRERIIGMHPDTFRTFMSSYEMQMYFKQQRGSEHPSYSGKDQQVGQIMGCDVIVNNNIPYGQIVIKTEMRWY